MSQEALNRDNSALLNIPLLTWLYYSKKAGTNSRYYNEEDLRLLPSDFLGKHDGALLLNPIAHDKESLEVFFFNVNANINNQQYFEELIHEIHFQNTDQNGQKTKDVPATDPVMIPKDKFVAIDKFAAQNIRSFKVVTTPHNVNNLSPEKQGYLGPMFKAANDPSIQYIGTHAKQMKSKLEFYFRSLKEMYLCTVRLSTYRYKHEVEIKCIEIKKAKVVFPQFRSFFERSAAKNPILLTEPYSSHVVRECTQIFNPRL